MKRSAKGLWALIVATGALGLAVQSQAATSDPDRIPQITVRYGDLDLSSDQGVADLYRRIESAARQVCGGIDPPRDLRRKALWRECYQATIAKAVETADRPALTAFYRARAARSPA